MDVSKRRAALSALLWASPLPVRTRAPSRENATEVTLDAWPSKRRTSPPVAASHSRAVLSYEPVRTYAPSGDHATDVTRPPCPWRRWSSFPVAVSQRRAVWSAEPVRTRAPSGENATEVTASVWPVNRRTSFPVADSHRRAVWSAEPVSSCAPSRANATEVTAPSCPTTRRRTRPVAVSHRRAVLSLEPVTTCAPSAESATEVTPSVCPSCATRTGRGADAGPAPSSEVAGLAHSDNAASSPTDDRSATRRVLHAIPRGCAATGRRVNSEGPVDSPPPMWTPRTRAGALLVAVLAAGAAAWFAFSRARARDPDEPPPPPSHVAVAADTYALLVGCTEYPELKAASDPALYEANIRLEGPGNDVVAMRRALRAYLGVPDEHIRVLTGWPDDAAARPTRANILGHLDRLAREVPRGAHVLFLFSGHGSQQPDEPNGDEADGMDEILLPADSGRWDPVKRGVANVIVDDEIHARLLALHDAGAQVWAVFDCCHSGTMMRGVAPDDAPRGAGDVGAPESVRMRGLTPELLGIPSSELASVAGRGVDSDGGLLGPATRPCRASP